MAVNFELDSLLKTRHKALRTTPDALLLGPTGARLWADYVDPAPGFAGRFDLIHKVNIPLLFTVKNNLVSSYDGYKADWYPSHLDFTYESRKLTLRDRKYITWDDCAVSWQTWTNTSGEELVLKLDTYEDLFTREGNRMYGVFPIEHKSYDVAVAVAVSDAKLLDELRLQPGETKELIIAAATGIPGTDDKQQLLERAGAIVESAQSGENLLQAHIQNYMKWYEKAPVFQSSDPVLDKTWAYRWFILRHNLADPKYGFLQHPLFYEGRTHKKGKQPFSKGGWEFSKLINLSVPHHLTDARWYHDPHYCEGSLKNMEENKNDEDLFACIMVDQIMHSFANFGLWAAYQLYLVHRNDDVMKKLLPEIKNQIEAHRKVYGTENDELMIEWRHTRTGKEYQPSYWYFGEIPRNPKADKSTYTHVKRVDRTIYHYLNTLGVAKLCRALSDPEAEKFEKLAEETKQDVLDKMWDEDSEFFYDLHYETDEKAFVKNIVGFYPGWAEILDERFNGMIEHLFNKKEFNTGAPFPTVAADEDLYAKEGGWWGLFLKGRNGCMWNGPTWPYTNGIALDALARESKRLNHQYDEEFGHFLKEYSYQHFHFRDLDQPHLVEHYNSETGEPLSDEQEYNHSYYIDLIVGHVAGLAIEEDRIVLDPIRTDLDYFTLDNIKAAGLDIKVTWCKPGIKYAPEEYEAGYKLYVNGKEVFASEARERAEVKFADLK